MALGRYMFGRGGWRVAAVAMEEARHFGEDPAIVAVDIAPVYSMLGIADSLHKRPDDWAALAALPSAAVPLGERLRADYLHTSPPDMLGPDSSIVMYTVSDSHLLGRVKLAIGNDTVFAVIDARVHGLVLDTTWMRRDSVGETVRAQRITRSRAGVRRHFSREDGRRHFRQCARAVPGIQDAGERADRARRVRRTRGDVRSARGLSDGEEGRPSGKHAPGLADPVILRQERRDGREGRHDVPRGTSGRAAVFSHGEMDV